MTRALRRRSGAARPYRKSRADRRVEAEFRAVVRSGRDASAQLEVLNDLRPGAAAKERARLAAQ